MPGFDFPGGSPLIGDDLAPTMPWLQVFTRWQRVIVAAQESGTTANRPTKLLWVGRPYFDTTIGKPVWVKTASPVVWVDATGAAV
jgi:hypothetical protein